MAWQLFDNWKDGKLGEIDTVVSFDKEGSWNLAIGLFLAGFLIMLTWYVFKKKLM